MVEQLSPALARRVALAAQGFGRPRPESVDTRQLTATIDRIRPLQIDSVNVFERSHYLPLFARLGAYDRSTLDAITFGRRSRYLEYWAHEAALVRLEDFPLFRWRMQYYRDRMSREGEWAPANAPMLDWLRAELASSGPMRASEIEHDSNVRRGPWWGWSDVKQGLEVLFRWGEAVSAGRTRFERTYALASDVLPPHVLEHEPSTADAVRELVRRSAIAHGVGSLGDLGDYFRLKNAPVLAAIHDLVDSGELLPVTVRGWDARGKPIPLWLHRDARLPRRMDAQALLSPFDPVVWRRERAERFFDFHYRIEIYTPAPQRIYGYYVLPVLIDDAIVARVDLKSDRQAGVLRVQAAWLEPGAPADTAERLAGLLADAAAWQGLDTIEVVDRGTLAPALRAAVVGLAL
ncbi:winged helix-turn-helix domain-containing protein [Microbacteriaceae bacterium VKM Ac-2855]|nr:winged helix-turn-helix domain-containing protein [Microbacteriaceae bacterium VKM Ac-2855]